jgi:hypothetical protein
MATYSVTNKYLIDDYAVLQLLTPTELEVGQSITVAAVDATFNGTYTVRALPQYLFEGVDTEGDLLYDVNIPIANQVLYAKTAADVERTAASGTLTSTPTCTWITATDIEDWLGIGTATAADATFLTICAASSSINSVGAEEWKPAMSTPLRPSHRKTSNLERLCMAALVPSARIHGFLRILPVNGNR